MGPNLRCKIPYLASWLRSSVQVKGFWEYVMPQAIEELVGIVIQFPCVYFVEITIVTSVVCYKFPCTDFSVVKLAWALYPNL